MTTNCNHLENKKFSQIFRQLLKRQGLLFLISYALKCLITILPSAFHKGYVDYYEMQAKIYPKSSQRAPQAIYEMLNIDPKKDVVMDIGCGDGETLGMIYKDNGIGVETSRHHAYEINRRCHAVVADAHHLPFRRDIVDVVVASEILEHLQQPEKCLRGINYIFKDGRKLGIVTPNESALRFRRLTGLPQLIKLSLLRYKAQHLHDLSLNNITPLLKRSKFEISKVKREIESWKVLGLVHRKDIFHWFIVCTKK